MPPKRRSQIGKPKLTPHPLRAGKPLKGPSTTLLLYTAMTNPRYSREGLARQLGLNFGILVTPRAASRLLERFRTAWDARVLENQGVTLGEVAKRMRKDRSGLSEAMNDSRYHLPPRAPRMSIAEIARKLNVSEKEIREWLDWKPEK